jgi:CheY-like chemotaxis protein
LTGSRITNNVAKARVVDDHASNRKLICEILRRRGHQWPAANNGIKAIEKIQYDDFDVVLIDVQMPRMDRLEATARIRQLDRTKSTIPIVAVTAYVTEDDRQRCLDDLRYSWCRT